MPYKRLYPKLWLKLNSKLAPTRDFADEILARLKILCDKTRKDRNAIIIETPKLSRQKSRDSEETKFYIVLDLTSKVRMRSLKIYTEMNNSELRTPLSYRMIDIASLRKYNLIPRFSSILKCILMIWCWRAKFIMTMSINRTLTEIFFNRTLAHRILPMASNKLILTHVKILSIFQKLTYTYLRTLLTEMMIRQILVMIQKLNVIQDQLHLPTWLILLTKKLELLKKKLLHVNTT